MIVYQAEKGKFLSDLLSNKIERIIQNSFLLKAGKHVGKSELLSWQQSLRYMGGVLNDDEIPDNSGVSIEYHIPRSNKRIDFILSGQDAEEKDYAILIELKQWSEALPTNKDGVVVTRFQHGETETSHPSYQVWSYAMLLEGYNEAVYNGDITLKPCAYLHNYQNSYGVNDTCYQNYIDKAPLFLAGDEEQIKLQDFIKQYVRYGDKNNIIYRIDSGRIRPSKALADSLHKMLTGKDEFIMIDDQKVVFETAIDLAEKASDTKKHVLIVEGGPGTGKTVVAINLLVELTHRNLVAQYVTKNAAPREVYESKLTGTMRKTEFSNLFTGSGSFTESKENAFDVLIVDEAHRLNRKSGMFKHLGENQIKEIINSSWLSVFLIDENQQVTWGDIGTKEEIEIWAQKLGAEVTYKELESQFRCNGSDGYLAWVDDVLQIRDTANVSLDDTEYDFRVFQSPTELNQEIISKNKINNKARIVAGYCWDWKSKKNPEAFDIEFPEFDFHKKWNLATDGNLWILGENSVEEIGCIHTCQGLEVDYIGVIIGDDLIVRDGKIITNPNNRAITDKSLNGYGRDKKEDANFASFKADQLIKNTYRTLMTRGMKGCYVYCTDPETARYFEDRIKIPAQDLESNSVEEIEDFEISFG